MASSSGERVLSGSVKREIAAWELSVTEKFNQEWNAKLDKLMINFNSSIAALKDDEAKTAIKRKRFEDGEMKSYQRKRDVAWHKLSKKIYDVHARAALNLEAALHVQRKLSDALVEPIPHGGRWITFPIRASEDTDSPYGEKTTISWIDATVREATYYKTTCWFGNLTGEQVPIELPASGKLDLDEQLDDGGYVDVPGSKRLDKTSVSKEIPTSVTIGRLEPFGETDLYIAAEFIEERYRGAPHLRGVHLKDRFPAETEWAYLCLDHFFHYGQDSSNSPKYRFLVYHPFVRTRNVPQRAFVENLRIKTAKLVAEGAAGSGNDYLAAAGQLSNMIVDALYDWRAHPLRRFDRLTATQPSTEIYSLSEQIRSLEVQLRDGDSDVRKDIQEIVGGFELHQEAHSIIDLAKETSVSNTANLLAPEEKLDEMVKKAVLESASEISSGSEAIAKRTSSVQPLREKGGGTAVQNKATSNNRYALSNNSTGRVSTDDFSQIRSRQPSVTSRRTDASDKVASSKVSANVFVVKTKGVGK